MLRRLESQCTGGARESEEVKVKEGRIKGREGVGETGEKERKDRGIRAKKDGTQTK